VSEYENEVMANGPEPDDMSLLASLKAAQEENEALKNVKKIGLHHSSLYMDAYEEAARYKAALDTLFLYIETGENPLENPYFVRVLKQALPNPTKEVEDE
tara:strand:+ start:2500 stop:2799 length:300 start_codon:yes stop_codon:yes gene_type:complete